MYMTKFRRAKKILNTYKKNFKILKYNNIDLFFVSDLDNIGYFSTIDPKKKYIGISIEYILINDLSLLHYTINHEITHVFDYLFNNGWRLDNSGNIIYHDEKFYLLFKLITKKIKNKLKENYKIIIPNKNKKNYV